MRSKQSKPSQAKSKYRCYSPTALTNAYKAVKEEKLSVRRASTQYGIPVQTLRDRVLGKIDPETVHSGPQPLLSMEEEAVFIEHVKSMASLGYGYTGAEILDMASNYAVYLGKRSKENPLTEKWYRNLKGRWPELKTISPRALSKDRAQATSQNAIKLYFDNLQQVLSRHDLFDKPQNIYNFDEKGIQTEHRPPKVLAAGDSVPGITSAKSSITTVMACGNAIGTQMPPYFVFKGQHMQQDLLDGCTPGVSGTVTEAGWSNTSTFLKYLDEHFLNFIQRSSTDEPILLILDGHRSHINVSVLDWAKQHNVIMLILPAHTSHVLQPLEVGCFGPMQRIYNAQSHKFLRESPAAKITHYNVCKLACVAYTSALSVTNLRSSFMKTGIFPLDREKVCMSQTAPSHAFLPSSSQAEPNGHEQDHPNSFFQPMNHFIAQRKGFEYDKQPRNTLSTIVSGKCITVSYVEAEIRAHCNQKQQKTSTKGKTKGNAKNTHLPSASPQPALSGTQNPKKMTVISDSSDDEMPDPEKCCVCHRLEPEELKDLVSVIYVKWAQCDVDGCNHWTHLRFCCEKKFLRLREKFVCPCHQPFGEE